MDRYSRLVLVCSLSLILIIVVFLPIPPETTLDAITIGVIDDYQPDNETSQRLNYIAKLAEHDIQQYLNETGTPVTVDVVFYPVNDWTEISPAVNMCYSNGTSLMVGFPDNLSLDLAMSYRYGNITLVSTGSTQPFGMNLDDTVYRLTPNRYHKLKPLAELIHAQGHQIVIPIADFNDGIEEFTTQFTQLGGNVTDTFWYDWIPNNDTQDLVFDYRQLYNQIYQLTTTTPLDDIAVLYYGYDEIATILENTKYYPNITLIEWYCYHENIYWSDSFTENVPHVGLYSLVANVTDTDTYQHINNQFKSEYGRGMSLTEANLYDGIWILALSALEADSQEVADLVNVIPTVAEEYVGASGRCELDNLGDRETITYEIYELSTSENNTIFTKTGSYNTETNMFTWLK